MSKLVLFGMSCVGKTMFAKKSGLYYYDFDALFPWHDIETLNLPISKALQHVKNTCIEESFVLDGWHLADKEGKYLPENSVVCVVFADYKKIISQYRVPVEFPEVHLPMFRKWYYDVDYGNFHNIRYIENDGEFIERSASYFQKFCQKLL